MNVFAIIFFVIIISGLSFLLVWNVYKLVSTLVQRRKSRKSNDSKDTKQEKGKDK